MKIVLNEGGCLLAAYFADEAPRRGELIEFSGFTYEVLMVVRKVNMDEQFAAYGNFLCCEDVAVDVKLAT